MNMYSEASEARKNELNNASRYYATLLSPWTLQKNQEIQPGDILPEFGTNFISFTTMIKKWNEPFSSEDGVLRKSFLSRCLLKYVNNVSGILKLDHSLKKLNIQYRSRIATEWSSKEIGVCDINAYLQKKLFGFAPERNPEAYTPDRYMEEGLHQQDDLSAITKIQDLADMSLTGVLTKGF